MQLTLEEKKHQNFIQRPKLSKIRNYKILIACNVNQQDLSNSIADYTLRETATKAVTGDVPF